MSDRPAGEQPDLQKLARDWVELWQSELTALANDREAREAWQAIVSLWAAAAAALFSVAPAPENRREDRSQAGSDGSGRTAEAPGAAAADAASDPRDAEIGRLTRRLAALEARLAELEGERAPRRRPSRTARKRPG